MTLVRKIDGEWQPQSGVVTIEKMIDTRTIHYADGRTEEEQCEPYPVPFVLNMAKVEELLASEVWTDDDLAPYGLQVAVPFEVPEGKQVVGQASYVEDDGIVSEVFDVEDIPPPPPPPTAEERLAAAGLTVEDLRALLAESEG